MKIRSIINYLALALPAVLALIGLGDEQFYMYALLSTAVTGGIQVLLALTMLPNHNSSLLYSYLTITALFFIVWYFVNSEAIFAVPPALAIFLTYIIYVERKKEKLIS